MELFIVIDSELGECDLVQGVFSTFQIAIEAADTTELYYHNRDVHKLLLDTVDTMSESLYSRKR